MLAVVITIFMVLGFLENVIPFHFLVLLEKFSSSSFFIFPEVLLKFNIAKEHSRSIAIGKNQILTCFTFETKIWLRHSLFKILSELLLDLPKYYSPQIREVFFCSVKI